MSITGYNSNDKDKNEDKNNNEPSQKTDKKTDFNYISQSNSKNDYNMKKLQEFFDIVKQMDNKTYEEREKIIEETWSETFLSKLPATIPYGDFAEIKIWKENEKYKMDCTTVQLPFDIIEKMYPEKYSLQRKNVEILIQKYTEWQKEQNKKDNPSHNNETDYLNAYRNININFRKK